MFANLYKKIYIKRGRKQKNKNKGLVNGAFFFLFFFSSNKFCRMVFLHRTFEMKIKVLLGCHWESGLRAEVVIWVAALNDVTQLWFLQCWLQSGVAFWVVNGVYAGGVGNKMGGGGGGFYTPAVSKLVVSQGWANTFDRYFWVRVAVQIMMWSLKQLASLLILW